METTSNSRLKRVHRSLHCEPSRPGVLVPELSGLLQGAFLCRFRSPMPKVPLPETWRLCNSWALSHSSSSKELRNGKRSFRRSVLLTISTGTQFCVFKFRILRGEYFRAPLGRFPLRVRIGSSGLFTSSFGSSSNSRSSVPVARRRRLDWVERRKCDGSEAAPRSLFLVCPTIFS